MDRNRSTPAGTPDDTRRARVSIVARGLAAVLATLGVTACAAAGSARDAAWKRLPPGTAGEAVRRTEHHRSADDPLGGTTRVYVIEASMSEADFDRWCAALGMQTEEVEERRADGEPVGYRIRRCVASRGKVHQTISFVVETGADRGEATYHSW